MSEIRLVDRLTRELTYEEYLFFDRFDIELGKILAARGMIRKNDPDTVIGDTK